MPTQYTSILKLYLTILSANNEFAIDFYKQVSDNDGNIFFSPVSMYMAFSALYEGARHDTAGQIQQVFGLDSDTSARHESMEQFVSYINQRDPYSTLKIANALWLADWLDVHDSYVDTVRNYYDAHVETLDLPNAGMEKINDWAAENTNDKINRVFFEPLPENTATVITNAIYFAGNWENPFPVQNTDIGDFWKNSEEHVEVDLMSQKNVFEYASSNEGQVLQIPYKGDRLSMLVILPDNIDGIDALEDSITADMIKQWRQEVHSTDITLVLPKFKIEATYDLIMILKDLGIRDVFNPSIADLSGIGNSPNLYVSSAFQKTFVDVNENGTEAAAVTALALSDSSSPLFVANHPFIFVIQDDETGAILFMGKGIGSHGMIPTW